MYPCKSEKIKGALQKKSNFNLLCYDIYNEILPFLYDINNNVGFNNLRIISKTFNFAVLHFHHMELQLKITRLVENCIRLSLSFYNKAFFYELQKHLYLYVKKLSYHSHKNIIYQDKYEKIKNTTIIQCATGCDFSAYLDNNNNVYTWGNNDHGQLGHGDYLSRNIPTKITSLTNIRKIIIIDNCLICINFTSNIFTCGNLRSITSQSYIKKNPKHEILSFPIEIPEKYLTIELKFLDSFFHYFEPAKKSNGINNFITEKEYIIGSHSSANQFGVVTNQGRAICKNLYLDKFSYPRNNNWHKMVNLPNNIIQLCFGIEHAISLGDDGEVNAWGSNSFGQLGIGSYEIIPESNIPCIVDFGSCLNEDDKIIKIFTIELCNLAVSQKGILFAWGKIDFLKQKIIGKPRRFDYRIDTQDIMLIDLAITSECLTIVYRDRIISINENGLSTYEPIAFQTYIEENIDIPEPLKDNQQNNIPIKNGSLLLMQLSRLNEKHIQRTPDNILIMLIHYLQQSESSDLNLNLSHSSQRTLKH
tara:strand:- start:10580 stop:12175 length:1596 start_codon:yes stop_codon:yes gene_type:complete